MSRKVSSTKTLAKKLADKSRVGRVFEVQDIEDTFKTPLFSPVQTRQQRKMNKTQINEVEKPTKIQAALIGIHYGDFEEVNDEPSSSKKSKKLGDVKGSPELGFVGNQNDLALTLHKEDKHFEKPYKWEPNNWRTILDNIRAMRAITDAPVDTMGCHKCSDTDADEKTQRFQKLVALMLSSQTKDEITFQAMQRLKSHQMTPAAIVAMERNELEELLKPVSFYKNKAKYLQLASQILVDKYEGDIPGTIKELEALPGVGPKMAHICMATAWNKVTGIGVDVHVHRITNRLRWISKPTKEPEQTRVALESWLPREMWQEVSYLLVGFGQTVCKAVRPHCMECLNREICPASEAKNLVEKKSANKILINNDSKNDKDTKKSKLQKPKSS